MEYKQAIQEARSRWREVLPYFAVPAKDKANGETSYTCPFCGHGSNGDGLTFDPKSKDGNTLHCFGCGYSGDIIDLVSKSQNISFYEALKQTCSFIGITVDEQRRQESAAAYFPPMQTSAPQRAPQNATEPQTDYTEFFKQAQHNNNGAYLESRGISKAIQDRFGVGFIPEWKHPKAPEQVKGHPYVIFPTSKSTYCARYTGTDESQSQYKKMHVGSGAPFFCESAALKEVGALFVVEGETDALSLWEIDRPAIALGSVANAGRFIKFAGQHKDRPYIIALDRDKAGAEAAKKIHSGLQEQGVQCYIADISGEYKDPNEHLVKDVIGFTKAAKRALLMATDPEAYKRELLGSKNIAAQLTNFWEEVHQTKNYQPIRTGFSLLDTALDGGFYPEQLVFMGAISSLGKTTLLLQIMDNIAAASIPCMLFSLEMSRNEIIGKSISRYTYTEAIKNNISRNNAKTMRGIIAGHRHLFYSRDELSLIQQASAVYGEIGRNIYLYEGNGDTGISEIVEQVKEFIRVSGQKPVVFIDYLQILAPSDPRATDKQNTDVAVKLLKQLARDEAIPIIAISSLNRDNYSRPISMEAFKESGAVEYSSDVLIGLQLKGVGTKDFDVNEAKRQDPREVELHILKNRNGVMSAPILYYYYPKFNFYHEIELVKREIKEKKTTKPVKVV